jgi:biopolymer transport protein TolQ
MKETASVSIINLVLQADIIVQLVIGILLVASLWSWAIIFDKILKFRILKERSDKFEEVIENASTPDEIYGKAKHSDNHPLGRIFLSCMKEWRSSATKQIIAQESAEKNASLKERLSAVMMVANNKSMEKLESGLNFLAIVGSSAPFVGLFGTVWGIMNSFQGIAVSKNTSLAVVAPGIAEALLATAIGLFAAIPAVFFYNIFSAKINQFSQRAENFSNQLLATLSRELDQ